jgi:hypothetical protein
MGLPGATNPSFSVLLAVSTKARRRCLRGAKKSLTPFVFGYVARIDVFSAREVRPGYCGGASCLAGLFGFRVLAPPAFALLEGLGAISPGSLAAGRGGWQVLRECAGARGRERAAPPQKKAPLTAGD